MALLRTTASRAASAVCARLTAPAATNTFNIDQAKFSTSSRMHVMDNPQQGNWIKKIYFDMVGFNQYGLYHDDLLEETDLVTEALRRLPPDLQDARTYRFCRATQLSMLKNVLPKEQRPTFEEDREHGRYLQPYLDVVTREHEEMLAWQQKNA
jgi:ubiquinol-cytochrome c reductase subunit 7